MDDVSWVFKLKVGDPVMICRKDPKLVLNRPLLESTLMHYYYKPAIMKTLFDAKLDEPTAEIEISERGGVTFVVSPMMIDAISSNQVDHPSHYGSADDPYETIKVLERWLTREEFIGFLKGNILKYTGRAGKKSGEPAEKDHAKSAWYDNYLTEFLKRSPA